MGLAAALMLTAISCTSEEPQAEKPSGMEKKTITFTFGDTFQTKAMTRAAITSLSLTDLWMFDYVGDELQQTIHQSNTDEGFGAISASMGYGEHILYFVASRGTTPTADTRRSLGRNRPTPIGRLPPSPLHQVLLRLRLSRSVVLPRACKSPSPTKCLQTPQFSPSRLHNGIMASIIPLARVSAFRRTTRDL